VGVLFGITQTMLGSANLIRFFKTHDLF